MRKKTMMMRATMTAIVTGRRQVPDGTWLRREAAVMVRERGVGAWDRTLGESPSKGITPVKAVLEGSKAREISVVPPLRGVKIKVA